MDSAFILFENEKKILSERAKFDMELTIAEISTEDEKAAVMREYHSTLRKINSDYAAQCLQHNEDLKRRAREKKAEDDRLAREKKAEDDRLALLTQLKQAQIAYSDSKGTEHEEMFKQLVDELSNALIRNFSVSIPQPVSSLPSFTSAVRLGVISISPSVASSPGTLQDEYKKLPPGYANPIAHAGFPMHGCWNSPMISPLPNILVSSCFRAFYLSRDEGLVDNDVVAPMWSLIKAVSVPDKETSITSNVMDALRSALGIDQIAAHGGKTYFKEQFSIGKYHSDSGIAVTLLSPTSVGNTSVTDPQHYLLCSIIEHKVANGYGDHQCAVDYLNTVTTPNTVGALKELVPVHKELVAAGFNHPVLAVIIEERNLRFEALHWSPVGVVMSRLGSCDLRPAPLHMDCAVLLTAARRCLRSLQVVNEAAVARLPSISTSPFVVCDIGSEITENALPDVSDILAEALLAPIDAYSQPSFPPSPPVDAVWEVMQVQAWTHSQVFRCRAKSNGSSAPLAGDRTSSSALLLKAGSCTVPSDMKMLAPRTQEIAMHWTTLSSLGLAPTLYKASVLDTWRVVVAEWLADPWMTLREALKKCVTSSREGSPDPFQIAFPALKQAVLDAACKMHGVGLAHGDLRDVNIMVRRSDTGDNTWEVRFVDLDWLCVEGEGRYPLDVNTTSVVRPDAVLPGGVICQQHDLDQIGIVFDNALQG